jgi:ABC transport system ATP-binding/permease protein
MRFRIMDASGGGREIVIEGDVVRFGRDEQCEVNFDRIAYPKVSGIHASISFADDGATLTPRSNSNKTLLNDEPLAGPATVEVGDRLRLGFTGPIIEILDLAPALNGAPAPVAEPLPLPEPLDEEVESTVRADSAAVAMMQSSQQADDYLLNEPELLIGRDHDQAQILLDHPHVSRLHARLTTHRGRTTLEDLRSANGTYVNGRLIKSVVLQQKDRIDIGPFSLVYENGALLSRSRANNIQLVAREVNRVVEDRATGKPLSLLNNINLVIQPKTFACLLGPSGSGKSTLLAILSGRNPPNDGAVTVNGRDLYLNFDALKQEIAVVPQKDILHDTLAVGAALRFTAELRLPPDTGGEEIDTAVDNILDVVNLSERRETLIRHLSGGQLKRASLANELMARPSLLFLDEVTSGLDEQTDREMMELFARVAKGGKTVVCITHNLANVEATCSQVVILTQGGCLAFVGTPDEAKEYFHIDRLGDVYLRLGERPADEWQAEFEKSSYYAAYVASRMPDEDEREDSAASEQREAERPKANPFTQAKVLTRRYLAIWRGDAAALFALLGQSLLVAFLLGLVFGVLSDKPFELRPLRTQHLLFLLTVSSFWFGCNTAAKELVKERIIFTRERGFNLRVGSYLASKFAILLLIGLAQVTLLFLIVRIWCGPEGTAFWQWLDFVALMIAGTSLGLMLSALARTEEVAVALVPIAVIPQIILAGAIAPLSGFAKALAWCTTTCYHGQGVVDALLPNAFLDALRRLQDDKSIGERSPGECMLALLIQAVVFVGVAYFLLVRQSRASSKG